MNEKQVLIVAKDQFALKRLSDEAMRAILPAYTQSINRIIEELRNLPEDSLTREMWLKSQLTTMERQLSQVSEQVLRVLPPKLVEAYEEGLKNAEQYLVAGGIEPPVPQQQLVASTVGGQTVTQPVNLPGLGISADGSFIQPSITRQQVLAAAQDRGFKEFLTGETGANRKGYSLQQLLKVNDKKAVDDIAAIMREGFLTGRSNQEIARRVGDAFGGRTKGQAVAMTNAVVRTGMAEASQAAHEMFYDANKDLLPKVPGGYKWEWDASNDTRLCEECAPLDGLRFKERDDAPAWPAHWNCRCKIVPITATEAQMREDGDVPEGSFLERQEVTYTDGKRNPPPPGYEPVKRGGTAYSRPQKQGVYQSGPKKGQPKMYWVRRVDMGKGKVYAGDMLQKMGRSGNFDSQRAILGNRATVERFNALTKSGAKYASDPQAAVRLLLSGNSSPPPGSIKPFFSGKRK